MNGFAELETTGHDIRGDVDAGGAPKMIWA